MTVLYISEYSAGQAGPHRTQVQAVVQPPKAAQKVSFTATYGTSAAFQADTVLIRVVSTGDCHFLVGSAPVADTNDDYLPAGGVEYFVVTPGDKISAVDA